MEYHKNGCLSWYFFQGTFTLPWRATAFLRNHGYSNAHSEGYSFQRVADMVENNKPLIIYALPGIDITSAHSWNIDGYKIKERTVVKSRYYEGEFLSSTELTDSVQMVHCDFGWGGYCNGYYVSGVFKLNDPEIEFDSGSAKNIDINYNSLIRLITYD